MPPQKNFPVYAPGNIVINNHWKERTKCYITGTIKYMLPIFYKLIL